MKKIVIVLLIMVLPVISVLGAGQKDLTKKPPGYGILVVGNEGKLTAVDGIRWIYEIVYENLDDGKEYSIKIPAQYKRIDFYYLPPGEYIARKEIPHHYSGSEFINNDERFINNYGEIRYGFTISEGQITLFNYNLYKFNNRKVAGKKLMVDVEDYVYPDSFIKKYGNKRYLYRWDYNDVTIQYLFFLPISKSVEKDILLSLIKIKGAEQWLYSPKYAANNEIWPNVPVKAAEAGETAVVKEKVEIPDWSAPDYVPEGDLYLLAMEIDSYSNNSLNLESAGKSSASFVSYIKNNEEKNYKNIIVDNVDNRNLTGKGIKEKLIETGRKVTENDRLIVYISSHGISDIMGRPYIFPSDGNIDNIPGSCLQFREFFSAIETRGPVIIVMDTGRTGSWVKNNKTYFSYDPEKLKDSISGLNKSMGVYFVRTGNFGNVEKTPFINNIEKLLQEDIWLTDFENIEQGMFLSTGEYNKFASEEHAGVQYRSEFLNRLNNLVKDRKRDAVLKVLEDDKTAKYFSTAYINELEKSISEYFDQYE